MCVPSSRGAAAAAVREDLARTPGTRPVPAQHAHMLSVVEDIVDVRLEVPPREPVEG